MGPRSPGELVQRRCSGRGRAYCPRAVAVAKAELARGGWGRARPCAVVVAGAELAWSRALPPSSHGRLPCRTLLPKGRAPNRVPPPPLCACPVITDSRCLRSARSQARAPATDVVHATQLPLCSLPSLPHETGPRSLRCSMRAGFRKRVGGRRENGRDMGDRKWRLHGRPSEILP